MLRLRILVSVLSAAFAAAGNAQKPAFPDFNKPAQTWRGAHSNITEPLYLVVGTTKAWTKLWHRHDAEAAVPVVDFTSTLVLAVFHPKWTNQGFRIDRICQGSLASDESSYNVFLTSLPKDAPPKADASAPANRFEMRAVHRTRLDFRFYAQGNQAAVSKAEMVARIDAPASHEPAPSLIVAAEKLLQEHAIADKERQNNIVAMLAAFGEPLRPYLNRLVAGDPGQDLEPRSGATPQHFWLVRQVFAKMLADEASAPGKALHHSEVTAAKAIAEVAKRITVKGEPWYANKQVRHQDGIWFIRMHGTFRIYSGLETCNQEGVNAEVAFRADNGKLLHCEIRRGDRNVDQLIQKNAPGVVPVDGKK